MRPRVRLLLAVLGLASLGSEFRSCGSRDVPPPGTALPAGDGRCVFDADCPTDPCFAVACNAGACVSRGPSTDFDGDGLAPAPCGTDCDDFDAAVRPGGRERCDGRDDDCDGRIDEGATGVRSTEITDGLRDAELIGLGDRFAVIGIGADGQIAGYLLGFDGSFLPPEVLFAPPPDERAVMFAAAGLGDRIFVAFATAGGPPSYLEARRDGELLRAGPPVSIGATGDTTALDAHVFGGQDWIVFDTVDPTAETRRTLWRSGDGALVPLVSADERPALADDEALLAVTNGGMEIHFAQPDGTLVATQRLPGTLASGPLASGDGAVIAAYRDAFDHSLAAVLPSARRTPVAAPSGARTDQVAVHRIAEGVLVTRVSDSLRAWILSSDLRTYLAMFNPRQLTPRFEPPTRVSAASDAARRSIVLTAYEGRTVAAFLFCDTSP